MAKVVVFAGLQRALFTITLLPLILSGCAAATPQPMTSPATAIDARLTPQPLTSPTAKLRSHMIERIRATPALCAQGKDLPALKLLLAQKADMDRASGNAKTANAQKLAETLKGQGVSVAAEDVASLSDAAIARARLFGDQARSDEQLKSKGTKAVGTDCDAQCVDAIVRTCAEPDAEITTRDSSTVGSSLLPGLSWQSSVASGLGNFLRDRATSETTLWIMNEIQDRWCKDLEDYFTHTCKLLRYAQGGAAPLSGALAVAAIRADLEELPLRLTKKRVLGDWGGPAGVDVLIQLLDGVRRGDAPLTLLAGLENNTALANECPSFKTDSLACSLRKVGALVGLLGLASQPTRSTEEPDFRSLAHQLADGIALMRKNDQLCPKLVICRLPENTSADKLEELLRLTHRMSQRLRQYSGQNLSNEQRLIESGEILGQTAAIMRTVQEIWSDGKDVDHRWKATGQAIEAASLILRGQRAEGTLRIIDIVDTKNCAANGPDCVPVKLLEQIPFVVDVASAERPEDMQAALQAAAAPVGSWRVKRKEAPMWTVTAFVGGIGGIEKPANGSGRPATSSAGAMAALGLDWTLAGGTWGEFGVLGSIVDVGQLLTTPVDPPERSLDSQHEARAQGGAPFEAIQILSPGAYLHYGVAETPLVLGFGYSLSPRLREYVTTSTATGATTSNNFTVHRFMAFAAIDVTLFPL